MNNPFDYKPDTACKNAFNDLLARIATIKESGKPEDSEFLRELDEGKMLGVLIAIDGDGLRHTLYAFSGQFGAGGFHYPGFVGPAFDYLEPDGFFKTKMHEISNLHNEITHYENGPYQTVKSDYERAETALNAKVSEYKEKCRRSKADRDAIRNSGVIDDEILGEMIRRSQFEKAELHRLKKRCTALLEPLAASLENAESHLEELRQKCSSESRSLQNWLFSNFKLLNAAGDSRSLTDIFADTSMKVPPSGAGECCAPKLLQTAYLRGWRPVSMAEFWYGKSKNGEVRIHGESYPACRGKCLPILTWMLRGLDIDPPIECVFTAVSAQEPEIIYENSRFCVIDKPAGMLSVPGKSIADSLEQWLADKYGPDRFVKMAHRLDMDTSGLLIAAFDSASHKAIQSLFARRKVKKVYVADLEGDYEMTGIPRKGRIELPLSPDWLDRPRQRVDSEDGKEAVTDYEFESSCDGRSRVSFYPLTGRTHQLRIHAASAMGLGMPIVGDRLYGRNVGDSLQRLHLHARKLEFIFPIDGKKYCFESRVPFSL